MKRYGDVLKDANIIPNAIEGEIYSTELPPESQEHFTGTADRKIDGMPGVKSMSSPQTRFSLPQSALNVEILVTHESQAA